MRLRALPVPFVLFWITLAFCALVVHPAPSLAGGVADGHAFALGHGAPGVIPGSAAIVAPVGGTGPDWYDLFGTGGAWRDVTNGAGGTGPDGIPDFIQLYGGRHAVFMNDDVSLGGSLDFTALDDEGRVVNAVIAPADDIRRAYSYLTADRSGDLLLFAGVERAAANDGLVEFEFSQAHVRLGHGPPWVITGSQMPGDLLLRLEFAGGAPVAISAWRWEVLADGAQGFVLVESLAGEGCVTDASLCGCGNAATIAGGAWTAPGEPALTAGRFAEAGVNLTRLGGLASDYVAVQVRTAADICFGYFEEGN